MVNINIYGFKEIRFFIVKGYSKFYSMVFVYDGFMYGLSSLGLLGITCYLLSF